MFEEPKIFFSFETLSLKVKFINEFLNAQSNLGFIIMRKLAVNLIYFLISFSEGDSLGPLLILRALLRV